MNDDAIAAQVFKYNIVVKFLVRHRVEYQAFFPNVISTAINHTERPLSLIKDLSLIDAARRRDTSTSGDVVQTCW
jgi:hypothetical protein